MSDTIRITIDIIVIEKKKHAFVERLLESRRILKSIDYDRSLKVGEFCDEVLTWMELSLENCAVRYFVGEGYEINNKEEIKLLQSYKEIHIKYFSTSSIVSPTLVLVGNQLFPPSNDKSVACLSTPLKAIESPNHAMIVDQSNELIVTNQSPELHRDGQQLVETVTPKKKRTRAKKKKKTTVPIATEQLQEIEELSETPPPALASTSCSSVVQETIKESSTTVVRTPLVPTTPSNHTNTATTTTITTTPLIDVREIWSYMNTIASPTKGSVKKANKSSKNDDDHQITSPDAATTTGKKRKRSSKSNSRNIEQGTLVASDQTDNNTLSTNSANSALKEPEQVVYSFRKVLSIDELQVTDFIRFQLIVLDMNSRCPKLSEIFQGRMKKVADTKATMEIRLFNDDVVRMQSVLDDENVMATEIHLQNNVLSVEWKDVNNAEKQYEVILDSNSSSGSNNELNDVWDLLTSKRQALMQ